ncbi:hypothetical protein Hanom_Chr12g01180451 [Helianthus anomalus]
MTVKLPVKLVWLKDRTQVSLGLLSLPTNALLCTKCELNLHHSREMQGFHPLIQSDFDFLFCFLLAFILFYFILF